MSGKHLLGLAAVALVAAGAWSLQRRAGNRLGPLEPLTWLVDGVWRPRDPADSPARSFAWSSRGMVLRETRRDAEGEPAGEVTYHWHHGKDEIAVYGVLPNGHFEGVLRTEPGGAFELQWKLYLDQEGEELYRERLSPDGRDQLRWTLRHRTNDQEVLVREAILIRRRR